MSDKETIQKDIQKEYERMVKPEEAEAEVVCDANWRRRAVNETEEKTYLGVPTNVTFSGMTIWISNRPPKEDGTPDDRPISIYGDPV